MDSESWGTRTSVIAMIIFSVFKIWGALFGQHEAFASAESLLQQRLVLFLVFGQVTHCRRSGSGTTGVVKLLTFGHVLVDVMLNVEPCTLVLRFVLNPDNFLGVAVLSQLCLEGLVGKWIQLLHTDNGN